MARAINLLAAVASAAAAVMIVGGGLAPRALAQTASTPAKAGDSLVPRPVVGVLDIQHIMSKAKAARQIARQREQYLNVYQAEAAEQEKILRDADQKLASERAALSLEEFDARRQAFQARIAEYQKQTQTRRRNLEKAFNSATGRIQEAIIRATDTVAGQHGMNLVLYRSQVFLFDQQMDITKEILDDVDRTLPSLTMADPDSLGNAAGEGAGDGTVDLGKGAH